ncbi:hypothetical protein POM88_002048 [Heracleum sosnowskyi]|uniref:Uncharacterized protein n=1 Tax=Heracleum sosnowskyi TaxID=360622 RepID=A0AAD8JES7_9APIA|nr:hypothetical protein POM88_002048 [Heracleum sosnowskyi]
MPLLNCLDGRIISIKESHNLAKVSSIIRDNHWSLPPSNNMFAIELRAILESVPLHQQDTITWDDIKASKVKMSILFEERALPGSFAPGLVRRNSWKEITGPMV